MPLPTATGHLARVIRSCAVAIFAGSLASGYSEDAARPSNKAEPPMVSLKMPANTFVQTEGTLRMVERLKGLDREVDPVAVPYFAGKTAQVYLRKIENARTPTEHASLMPLYANALLNDGRSEEALKVLEDFEQYCGEHGLRPPESEIPKFFLLRATAYLRVGEQENCLTNHNADSCLLPIRGGGVHLSQRGSRGAIGVLNELLDAQPTPYAAWLLNIAYMTLGEYPDKVPAAWRVPPEVFDSDYDIKRFPDVAGPLGIAVDDLAGGVVLDDFDNDGLLDLMVSSCGLDSQLRLFRNKGDGIFDDRAASAGLAGLTGGLNMVQADYDNDGFVDVFVLRGGWLGKDGRYPNSLLRNNGDFTFTDVTEEAGLLSFHSTQTAVWIDFDGDGRLDLFIGNESIPGSGAKDPCELYRNNGDGTFTECAAACGVDVVDWVKAAVGGDFNNDGRPDLFLSVFGGKNILLRNDGPPGKVSNSNTQWLFKDVAQTAGVGDPARSFPCWFFDYDNDGWLDIFVCGYAVRNAGDVMADYLGVAPAEAERPRLYHNNRDGTFSEVTRQAGLWKVLETMGANFGDLDNDGWLDFYLGTGDPSYGTLIPNRMFRNDGGRRFQDVTTSGGFGQLQKGHGIAFGDIDNDGDEDVYAVIGGALLGDHYPNQLFANPGHGNHWIKLKLEGVRANTSAIGARIKVVVRSGTGERAIQRVVGSGGNFGASPLRQEVGLGDATGILRAEITWPGSGTKETISDLSLDRAYAVREGDGKARELRLTKFALPGPDMDGHMHMSH